MMFESVGAGSFDTVRRTVPVLSVPFVAPSWSQKRQRSDDDEPRFYSSRDSSDRSSERPRRHRREDDGFVSAPIDTRRFQPAAPKARRDAVTRVLEEAVREEALEADRQRHLRYNPELPHLLRDPLETCAAQQQVASASAQPVAATPISQPAPETRTQLLVLDTCVLLRPADPVAMLESLVDRSVLLVVPFTVMSELDFRSKEGEGTENDGSHGARRKIQTGCAAREARNWISSQIATTDGGVHIQSLQEVDVSRLRACVNNDDKILACASYFKEKVPCADVIVATNDLNLSLKAKAEGFELLSSEDMDPCPEFSNRRTRQLKSRSVPSRRR